MHKSSLLFIPALLGLFAASLATAQSSGRVTVTEVVVARAIEDHEPVGAGTTFSAADGPFFCFVRVENRSRAEGAVFVAWEAADGGPASARGGLRLAISASPRFRTYARNGMTRAAGAYRCVVRDEDGNVLGSAEYTLTD
jgi:Protein of unknown function (DUF2914)